MSIVFKNVGELSSVVAKRRIDVATAAARPIGIVTPVRSGDDTDGLFKMHRSIADQVKDNLRNLLLTNHGERVAQYHYGANLRPLMLELTSQASFDVEAQGRIQRAVERYMPFITLNSFRSRIITTMSQDSLAKLSITITYSIPTLGVIDDTIDVVFFIGG